MYKKTLPALCFIAFLLFILLAALKQIPQQATVRVEPGSMPVSSVPALVNTIGNIPLPKNYQRLKVDEKSFAGWLRKVSLKKNNTVYMYNKKPVANQSLHYAVLDVSTGDRDLQQCADALMRLRAEYLFSISAYDKINFIGSDRTVFNFKEFARGKRYALHGQHISSYQSANGNLCYTHGCLLQFLNWVFSYCGTYTLQSQTSAISDFNDVSPGDMLVKAGSPGHAMMVVDVAVNSTTGKKCYMLLQGFMPAQDIHIVKNPNNPVLSPWFEVKDGEEKIITPGWIFETSQLRKW